MKEELHTHTNFPTDLQHLTPPGQLRVRQFKSQEVPEPSGMLCLCRLCVEELGWQGADAIYKKNPTESQFWKLLLKGSFVNTMGSVRFWSGYSVGFWA